MNNEAHVRIPVLVSSGSWGVFGNSMRPAYFDVARSDPEVVRAVFNDPALELYLMAAPEPLAITERYVALTAQPAIPPVWAFAPIQWRNEIAGQAEVLWDATDIRANQVPTGAIWIDRPYQTHYNSMDFDPARYPDPDFMVQQLHDRGFRLAGWNAPYLHPDDPDYDMAEAAGWFIEGTFVFTSFGKMLDLTHPDCMAFWQDRVAAARDLGIEGWKLDYAEDIQIGLSDARMDFSFHSGEDERTMNRRYAEYYHRAYAEPLGLPEVFIIARAGTIGGQRYASVIWPGDLDSDFKEFGFEDAEGTIHVGGLPSAVRAGTGLSVSGYPFFASDTGGFRHNRPTHEVMIRWTEYAALLPIMQYGGGGDNHNPWDFTDYGDSQFTTETLELFNRYGSLHIRLFPYFYTYARQAHETGRPVIRPFGLAYPQDGRHPDFTFLSGPDLLVAPVVDESTERNVPLPAGTWIDWWTGEVVEGPVDVTVAAPLDTLPLYLRAGGIVPMLRPTVMTLSPATDPTVDTYDGNPGRIWGRVAPQENAENSLTLHDDTVLAVVGAGDGSVELRYEPGSAYAGLRIQVHAPDATQVERDGTAVSEAGSENELDSCQACWYRRGSEPWIWLALDPGQTGPYTFTLR
jgi:alpha-D-xyloside xylohydrolase